MLIVADWLLLLLRQAEPVLQAVTEKDCVLQALVEAVLLEVELTERETLPDMHRLGD